MKLTYPLTQTVPQTDDYHGTLVADPSAGSKMSTRPKPWTGFAARWSKANDQENR
jgi:hypothetical protein